MAPRRDIEGLIVISPCAWSEQRLVWCDAPGRLFVGAPDVSAAHERVEPATPTVSIGLPVYNGAQFLAQAIESLLDQTYRNLEIIISDNGSTDQTEEICRRYARQDARVRYYRARTNLGASRNYNRTFELARGKYFKWAAHDDICERDFLARCVQALDADPSAVLCFTYVTDIDGEGRPMRSRRSIVPAGGADPAERFRNMVRMDYTCEEVFGLARSSVLGKTGLIGNYADSDRVLLAHLALYGRFVEVPEVLFLHRLHDKSSVRIYPGRHERSAWFDPRAAGKPVFPYWREWRELLGVIARSELRARQRLACYRRMAWWLVRYRKLLRSDLRIWAIETLRRRAPWSRDVWRWLHARRAGAATQS
jgi:glycosyltransferase involved in cell wall biosynthesis